DVGVPRRAEHDARAHREAARGMRREIVGSEVGLDLHDAPDARDALEAADEKLAEEIAGDRDGVAVVELTGGTAPHAARLPSPSRGGIGRGWGSAVATPPPS